MLNMAATGAKFKMFLGLNTCASDLRKVPRRRPSLLIVDTVVIRVPRMIEIPVFITIRLLDIGMRGFGCPGTIVGLST